jgi:hypothetical protein
MQLKTLIRYPLDSRRARRLLAGKAVDDSLTGRPIALDLQTPQLLLDCGRHLAALAHHARAAGSPCYVRCSWLLLSAMVRKQHGREMLAEPHVRWIGTEQSLPAGALVLCDYEPPRTGEFVQMLIGRDIDRRLPVMPYPMHPATLRHLQPAELSRLRQSPRRMGVYFAGNQKARYGDAKMERMFGVLSRLETIGTLTTRFPERVARSTMLATPAHSIVITDSRDEPVAAADWLSKLAQARFFLCCPGASQPMCHNLVEAMSVGTIPIVEYGDRVTPELVDGQTAIGFRGRDGLIAAIERIDRLSQPQLAQLQANVASFYDQHLCGTRFLSRLRDGELDLSPGMVCMPFHERNYYRPIGSVAA